MSSRTIQYLLSVTIIIIIIIIIIVIIIIIIIIITRNTIFAVTREVRVKGNTASQTSEGGEGVWGKILAKNNDGRQTRLTLTTFT